MNIEIFKTQQGLEVTHTYGCYEEREEILRTTSILKSIQRKETVIWVHSTIKENIPNILRKGLAKGSGHMGIGVYFANTEDPISIKALLSFLYNDSICSNEKEYSFVFGVSNLEFLHCISGDYGQTGYCMFLESIPAEDILGVFDCQLRDLNQLTIQSIMDWSDYLIRVDMENQI